MGKIIFVISMSLDGYVAGPNVRLEEPMGEGGMVLHDWISDTSDPRNQEVITQGIGGIGAVIAGRGTYDMAIQGWRADGPTGDARVPVFIVSHGKPKDIPANGVYTFADSIGAALSQARATAGAKDITVMGGANIGQQFFKANLIDEIEIQLIPVLLNGGLRLFEHTGSQQIKLENVKAVQTAAATHLHFRVVK
jgi:dihydrofolate reductase